MIKIENLTYAYKIPDKLWFKKKEFIALNNINLDIAEGTSTAFLGFNGAGKSTLIKLIIGILRPKLGKVLFKGEPAHKNRKNNVKDIGVVWGQKSNLWWDIPVIDSFKALRQIYDVDKLLFEKNLMYLDDLLKVSEFWNQLPRRLSLGQRMRCEIMTSLLHSPNLIILDEPFLGLDFISKEKIILALKKKVEEGVTLILVSHSIEDIESLCKNIFILNKGELVANKNLESLENDIEKVNTITIKRKSNSEFILSENIRAKYKIEIKKIKEATILTYLDDGKGLNEIYKDIFINNNEIIDIKVNDDILKNIIMKNIGGNNI